jgi:ankyrin repeat protein
VDSLLDKRTKSQVQSSLDTLSKGSQTLEQAYGDAIERLKSQLPGDTMLAIRVLTWIIYAERFLTTSELRHALAVEYGQFCLDVDNLLDVEDIVSVCAGLVTIDKESDIIHLVHYTTQEYFESIRNDWNPDGQLDITRTCLTYLSFDTFRSGNCRSLDEFEAPSKDYPFLDYAAQHWGKHAASVQDEVSELACSVLLDKNLVSNIVQAVPAYFYEDRCYHQPNPERRTGLHVIAAQGLRKLAQKLLTECTKDPDFWIDGRDFEGRTPLYVAAEHGHASMVELFLEHGADVNARGGVCDFALSAALLTGKDSVVELLIRKGADTNLLDRSPTLLRAFQTRNERLVKLTLKQCTGSVAFSVSHYRLAHIAARRDWHETLPLLLDRDPDVSVDILDHRGRTPLHEACYINSLKIARLLLDRGANANHADKEGWTPLHITSSRSRIEMTRLLLEKGATPTIRNSLKQTALNYATYKGFAEIVELLLRHGADVDNSGIDGMTPLYCASHQGNSEVVELLLLNAANPNSAQETGWTPLMGATISGHTEIVRILLERGANPSIAITNSGWTPLMVSSYKGNTKIVKLLLDRGANLSITNTIGSSPLLIASSEGKTETVELLHDRGANPNIASIDVSPPLILASSRGHTEVVRLLLDRGVNPNTANMKGWTALMAASSTSNTDTVKLLLNRGADLNMVCQSGWSSLKVAAYYDRPKIVELLLPTNVASDKSWTILASKGYTHLLKLAHNQYNVNLRLIDSNGNNLLHIAARHGHLDTMKFLADIGIDPLAPDAKGDNLLCYVALSGSLDICNAVLNMGVVPLAQSGRWTPLHWACKRGDPDVIKRLIQEGAQGSGVILSQSNHTWYPTDIAIFHGHEGMLRNLPQACKAALGSGPNGNCIEGKRHDTVFCDSCGEVCNGTQNLVQRLHFPVYIRHTIFLQHMFRLRLLFYV